MPTRSLQCAAWPVRSARRRNSPVRLAAIGQIRPAEQPHGVVEKDVAALRLGEVRRRAEPRDRLRRGLGPHHLVRAEQDALAEAVDHELLKIMIHKRTRLGPVDRAQVDVDLRIGMQQRHRVIEKGPAGMHDDQLHARVTHQHLLERGRVAQALAVQRLAAVDDARRPGARVHRDRDVQRIGQRPQRLKTRIVMGDAVVLVFDLADHRQLARRMPSPDLVEHGGIGDVVDLQPAAQARRIEGDDAIVRRRAGAAHDRPHHAGLAQGRGGGPGVVRTVEHPHGLAIA